MSTLKERISELVSRKFSTVARAVSAPKEEIRLSRSSKIPSLDDFANGNFAASFFRPLSHLKRDFEAVEVHAGAIIRGRIVGLPHFGLLISLQSCINVTADDELTESVFQPADLKLRTMCFKEEIPRGMHLSSMKIGDDVIGLVLSVDRENERVLVSFRPSLMSEGKRRLISLGPQNDGVEAPSAAVTFDANESSDANNQLRTYAAVLQEYSEFRNTFSIDELYDRYHINTRASFFNSSSQGRVSAFEISSSLRKRQDEAYATESVIVGVTHQKAQRYQEASVYYGRALKTCPNHVDALVARGSLHTACEEYDLAIADLTKAIGLDKNHKNAPKYLEITLLRRGLKQLALGKIDEAAVDFSSAMDLNGPKHEDAVKELENVKKILEKRAMAMKSAEFTMRSTYALSSPALPVAPATPSAKGPSPFSPSALKDQKTLAAIRELLHQKEEKKSKKDKKEHKHKHKHKSKKDKETHRRDSHGQSDDSSESEDDRDVKRAPNPPK